MIKYKGKAYYSAKDASKAFGVTLSTFYYWRNTKVLELGLLNLGEFCLATGIQPTDLRATFYMEKEFLRKLTARMKGRTE